MKRILTIMAVCVGGLVMAESANAQVGLNFTTPLGNGSRLGVSIGNAGVFGGTYGVPYGYARPVYPPVVVPAYPYGYVRPPVYGYPAYGRPVYGRPFGWRR
ncbi:hypothetical protein [Zavarzinella formosa]|uniref:hypothetical protein n=1 Tax=Zavarzinella formosa TaxID=360055 RepID=UPI0012F8F242|nr:hypothetical protein [Zavarzinella formosa]